ncbi:hypothetical protein AB0F93_03510 [Micromonospora tulbaghiae]|uniref:hypothetical protein n=1 Tax=Micromonospora tulbaghiae TaxID=479978 RepID=UPI003318EAA3
MTAGQALTAASYQMGNRTQQVLDMMLLLRELHGARELPDDPRCKTCRTSRGKPAPWPCVTYDRFSQLLQIPVGSGEREALRTLGRFLNREASTDDVKKAVAAIHVADPEPSL